MDEPKVVVSLETYSNYLEAIMKLQLLRETLPSISEYEWPKVITKVLYIEVDKA